ncbi:MAG TPA: polysaccharide biosynthesis/export family protein [Terracidiphilus sp.]|nr:polysaccharide biosynthesis/export family protein [Terracidiphilus sp.]
MGTRPGAQVSFGEIGGLVVRRGRFMAWVVGVPLLACIVYCLVAPRQYEAKARIALRAVPATSLRLDGTGETISGSFASGETQLETLANVFRSDQLAWDVISSQKLYQAPGFTGSFSRRFPRFHADAPDPEAEAYLLERFRRRLTVQTLPRTLIVQIRFRSNDPALSAAVVNDLIRADARLDTETRIQTTAEASGWLDGQLQALKAKIDSDEKRLAEFQKAHGLLETPESEADGRPETPETTASLEMDELGRDLASASADRMMREAEYRAALNGDPELVAATDPRLESDNGSSTSAVLQKLHARSSDLAQEQAGLSLEHGPNFPRAVEIRRQLQDIDRQIKTQDAKLVDRFHDAWMIAADREKLDRENLDRMTKQGMDLDEAATQAAMMRREIDSTHELYTRVMEKKEEAGLSAGVGGTDFSVIDVARIPVKAASPDLAVYAAITLFVSLWLALGGAFLLDSLRPQAIQAAGMVLLVAAALSTTMAHAQAPTPSTSGLPTGVAHIPQSEETKSQPNAKEAPEVWANPEGAPHPGTVWNAKASATVMPAEIGAADLLDISEFHTPEFHSVVRVSDEGTVTLPLAGEVRIGGMNERSAARAIEAALVARGMLLHPQVNVLVTAYAGRDVSVLGEVARPGVYPYTQHHRLLDLISAASGLTPAAGSLVTIVHRNQPNTPQAVVLDPGASDTGTDRNPELEVGDTVQVNRAGLVYVIGDVIRPGGFPVDPVQRMTVVKALSLAWGPSQNAALTRGILIREQKDGRTLTSLNLKRLLRGQDPDLPIQDHDILFIPDSTARNLWNRTMESVIQSAAGVSIYAGLVYSQRF